MERRASRRLTPINYAKMAAGDYGEEDVSGGDGEQGRNDDHGEQQDYSSGSGEKRSYTPTTPTRRRRKPRESRSAAIARPASLSPEKTGSSGKATSVSPVEKPKGLRKLSKISSPSLTADEKKSLKRKSRTILSDDSEDDVDDGLGVDNDESEDFVPLKARDEGLVEEDDYMLEEDDQDLEEAELEALEEAVKARKGALLAAKGKVPEKSRPPVQEKRLCSAVKVSPKANPKPLLRAMPAPALPRSLSGGRTLPSPSSSMMKGTQGRLLKKIGFKAPLVTASAVRSSETLRQKSLPKGVGGGLAAEKPQSSTSSIPGKLSKNTSAPRPWFSTPGQGKWDRKSTALLDDAALFSQAQADAASVPPSVEIPSVAAIDGSESASPGKPSCDTQPAVMPQVPESSAVHTVGAAAVEGECLDGLRDSERLGQDAATAGRGTAREEGEFLGSVLKDGTVSGPVDAATHPGHGILGHGVFPTNSQSLTAAL